MNWKRETNCAVCVAPFSRNHFYADPRESVHINENSIVNDDV